MNPYFVTHGDDWGVLVIAHNWRAARDLGYLEIKSMLEPAEPVEWTDIRCRRIRPPEHALAQANQAKLARGEAHAVSVWDRCPWHGEEVNEAGRCARCPGKEA